MRLAFFFCFCRVCELFVNENSFQIFAFFRLFFEIMKIIFKIRPFAKLRRFYFIKYLKYLYLQNISLYFQKNFQNMLTNQYFYDKIVNVKVIFIHFEKHFRNFHFLM